MSELQLEAVVDITKTTLENYGKRGAFTDLTSEVQSYWAWNNLFNKDVETETGYYLTRRVLTEDQPNARAVPLYSKDSTQVKDGFQTITMNFRNIETSFMFDLGEEEAQSGPEAIVKVVKARRYGAMVAAIKLFEEMWWVLPASDNGLDVMGFPYWATIDTSVTAATVALTSATYAVPWTGVYPGGLNHAQYRNYAGAYTSVTVGDLIRQMRYAWLQMDYTHPIPHPTYDQGKSRYMIAMDTPTLLAIEDIASAQNDNMGNDVDRMGGETVFRGRPMRRVPWYDKITAYNTSHPVDFIDWSKLYLIGKKGWMAREMTIPHYQGRHNCVGVTFDWKLTSFCHDRRSLCRLSIA
jgi:hypothetical protein